MKLYKTMLSYHGVLVTMTIQATHCSLTSRGYGIPKENASDIDLQTIKTELTVSPIVPMAMQQQAQTFQLYMESSKKL
jgi:hypothetical protein